MVRHGVDLRAVRRRGKDRLHELLRDRRRDAAAEAVRAGARRRPRRRAPGSRPGRRRRTRRRRRRGVPVSAVPVLPATVTPGICALRAGAALDGLDHHVADRGGGLRRLAACEYMRGRILETTSPSGASDLLHEPRRHHVALVRDRRPRPSPSAAASRRRRSWPKARRPGSTCGRRVLRVEELVRLRVVAAPRRARVSDGVSSGGFE